MKPAIPQVRSTDPYLFTFLDAIKNNVEQINGVRGGLIDPLATTATTAEIVAKINEIIARLNYK